jgi:hypothetical protein
MHREIVSRVVAAAQWGHWQEVPVLVGEGWVGYTPLEGKFEEGPIGRALAAHGIRTAAENGVWGVVPSSNCAFNHPMWQDADWQTEINEEFRRA